MKQLSLKDIQKVSLEILKDVHDFCISNNINYSLAYGSMLGAVRHKGFIPWDDDIDIVMPRPDYERFKRLFKSNNNILVTEEESYIAFSRVCDVNLTFASKSPWPWVLHQESRGVWIDIFPLDAIEDDKQTFSKRMTNLDLLFKKQLRARNSRVHPSSDFGFIINVKQAIKNILYAGLDINKINSEIKSEARRLEWDSCSKCSMIVCEGNQDKEFFDKSLFQHTVLMPFENYEFCVATGWNEILRANYGDYMKLPPVEDRMQHSSHTKFYWK